MEFLSQTLISFIDDRIKDIIFGKAVWGPSDTIEGQVLQLLDCRNVCLHPTTNKFQLNEAQNNFYNSYLFSIFGDESKSSLACLCRKHSRENDFTPILNEFVRLTSLHQIENN